MFVVRRLIIFAQGAFLVVNIHGYFPVCQEILRYLKYVFMRIYMDMYIDCVGWQVFEDECCWSLLMYIFVFTFCCSGMTLCHFVFVFCEG